MTRLEWNLAGERTFEVGVDRGVLYPQYGPPVPWNGLTSVSEESTGGDVEPFYKDGVKYAQVVLAEDFEATIEAFSAPPEFAACEGERQLVPGLFATQQPRQSFGFSWRTLIGNDLEGSDFAYKLHLVYGAMVEPSGRQAQTLSASTTADTRQWKIHTVPPLASTYRPTAHFMFDSRYIDRLQLEDIESFLYGRPNTVARLLLQSEILDILANVIEEPLAATI